MALAIIDRGHKTLAVFSGTSTTLSVSGISSGSLLVIAAVWFDDDADLITQVSDDVNGNWTSTTRSGLFSNQNNAQFWYKENSGSNPTTITVTFGNTGSGNDFNLEFNVSEVTGAVTASALDANVTNTGTGTDFSTTWGTLAQADEILFQIGHHDGGPSSLTQDTGDGYTLIWETEGAAAVPHLVQYKIVSTTAPPVANITYGGGPVGWGTRGLSFKAASGSSPFAQSKKRFFFHGVRR
jgi:hypothetical protein